MERYTKNINMHGNLFADGIALGLLRYDLTYNPYDTNDMQIILYDPHISILDRLRNAKEAYIQSATSTSLYKITLNSQFISHHISIGSKISCPITEYTTFQRFKEFEKNNSLAIYYYFPLTSLSDFHNSFSNVNSEPLCKKIETDIGQYILHDIFQTESEKNNSLYEMMNLIKESALYITNLNFQLDYTHIVLESDHIADKICDIISLIDRDRIKWKRKEIFISNSSNKIIAFGENFRWASPTSDKYSYKTNHNEKRHSSLELIYNSYNKLSADKKKIIDELLTNFQIANCSKTVETELIHWHSCLDFLKKYYGSSKRNFSSAIVDIFDRNNIQLNDVIDKKLLSEIRNNNKHAIFEFTRIRNTYIHDGFGSIKNSYPIILSEVNKIRALCDRLFLRIFDIDFRDTCLGLAKT